jgi:hypothetical protein
MPISPSELFHLRLRHRRTPATDATAPAQPERKSIS